MLSRVFCFQVSFVAKRAPLDSVSFGKRQQSSMAENNERGREERNWQGIVTVIYSRRSFKNGSSERTKWCNGKEAARRVLASRERSFTQERVSGAFRAALEVHQFEQERGGGSRARVFDELTCKGERVDRHDLEGRSPAGNCRGRRTRSAVVDWLNKVAENLLGLQSSISSRLPPLLTFHLRPL